MAGKSVFKLYSITKFFGNEPKLIERGENALHSNHVKSMAFFPEINVIKGVVEASQRDKSNEVEVTLNDNGEIIDGTCMCPRGQFRCHHMATLLLYGHYNISVTDKACSWSKTKPAKGKTETMTVSQLFPLKVFKASTNCSSNLKEEVFNDLQQMNCTVGFSWILSPEPENEESVTFPCMEDVLFSNEFKISKDKALFLAQHCALTEPQIKCISQQTVGQSENWMWSKYRKFRITSSNFGCILKCHQRGRFPPSLFKRVSGINNLDGVKAIQWGRRNEQTAAHAFEKTVDKKIEDTGLWLDSSGLLGATPDRLVLFEDGSKGTVEIKCPFKYRNDLLQEALKREKKYIITIDKDGTYTLNKDHDYYHQMQGRMHIANCTKGYLVIWTLKGFLAFLIERNQAWSKTIEVLKSFFVNEYIPYLHGSRCP